MAIADCPAERPMADTETSDHIIRAITEDGAFRVLTARTTETCREAVARQGVKGATAAHFGDLVTGTVLVRETMAPELRVQGVVRGAGSHGTLVADSAKDGGTRGLVSGLEEGEDIVLGGDALMQFMRTLPMGRMHTGVVQVPSEGGISGALMAYMQESEQIFTVMACRTLFDAEGQVRSAGGYVVQLLPEAQSGVLAVMTERLRDFGDITPFIERDDYDPDVLLEELLYRMPFARIETRPVFHHCRCSATAVLSSLATLSAGEIRKMVEEREVLDIRCDYCGTEYRVPPGQLEGLLHSS